ncbi:nuclear transport factor 2 family protein [Arthrobacter sp. 260]|uniref:nuclear transport factor 2 family protein n=1 Tax=Arthrobacter sp. 260 TaxID=2735314 RepID=UPI001490B07A|nr:nuclear transport factor 2 family protein [Arthrobacter sp. 260]NOJ61501.1 SnoaL-like domain-containing protein [Arthrobacter sp. 260]
MKTRSGFGMDTLRQGVEGRDATLLASLYAENAEVTEVDNDHPPARPRTFIGGEQIAEHLRDVCSREMTHRLENPMVSGNRLTFTEACRYDDGTEVLSIATAEIDDRGKIVRQLAVTAWGS